MFHIIYPGGDRTQLKVLELSPAMAYELSEYAVASRHEFHDREAAVAYAKDLASKYNKVFVGSIPEDDYLD
jgi:hypothetical protein